GLVYYAMGGGGQRALEHFDRARTLFAEIGDRRGLIRADGNAGAQYYALGDFERALEHHRRVHAAASEIGDRRYTATSLGAMGQCEIALSRFSDAYAHLQEELRLSREIRDTYLEELCLENLGELFLMLGAHDRSIESYTAARKLAERTGNRVGAAACDIDIAGALIAKRDTEAAAKLLAGARRVLEEARDVNVSAMYHYRMGMLYLARGPVHDPTRALEAFHQLGETADANGFRSHRILSRSYAAFCRMLLGHPAEARDLSTEALAILESGGPLYGGCQDVLLNHALILRANRDLAAFVEYIDRAHAELMSAAESIHDVQLYRSFLEQVPAHAEIVREYSLAHRSDSQGAAAAIREQNLRTLYEVARNINSVLELPLLLDRIMDSALTAMNGERGLIFLIENDQLVLKVSRNVEKETIRDATEISLSILRDVVSGGRPIIVSDTSQDTAFRNRESVRNYHIHSLVCVPMRAKDRLIGTVYVDSRAGSLRTISFTDIDAEFLEAFANLAAIAIENARLHARLQDENLYLQKTVNRRFGFENIIGESAPMMKLFAETQAAIGSEAAVLISGESGTGKELIAKAIHYNGSRKAGRFVAVDCGALPDTLLESELFGYKRGAFTGAYTDKPGLFEEAHNGTLFLDEISNTSIAFQAKLLRVLQDGEFRRVGDTTTRTVNVRIICATNKNLAEEIEHGRFRQDLFYRLNVIPITVPPLRDRVSDIPLLVQHFIDRFKAKSPSPIRGATSELLEVLKTLPWKGNVRELENLINRMLTQAESDLLTTRDLPPEYQSAASQGPSAEIPVTLGMPRRLVTLQQIEREHILFVLQHTKGNKTEAARILGVKRTTLIERMKKLGLM
ncbi:MAG: sigma 54-interacting transcriptional regulator, partial [Bacteroidota bacterium]|nr:sigma 54-interacting transcriptional regulator [Bacteroidota bacterium]